MNMKMYKRKNCFQNKKQVLIKHVVREQSRVTLLLEAV